MNFCRADGVSGYSENLAAALLDDYGAALNPAISKHLVRAFGGRARDVLQTSLEATSGSEDGAKDLSVQALQPLLEPLVEGFPYLEAEVVYAARHEYAVRAEDVLARRTRLAFLNRKVFACLCNCFIVCKWQRQLLQPIL